MIWNHLLHAVFGFVARDALTWSTKGLLICFAVTGVVRAIDTARFYSYSTRRLVAERPDAIHDGHLEAVKRGAPYKLAQLWIAKVLWYGGVSMAVASMSR